MSASESGATRKIIRKSPMLDRRTNSSASMRPKPRPTPNIQRRDLSDSDDSDENESIESEQTDSQESKSKKQRRKARGDWEIVEGLRDGQKCDDKPEKYEGYMMKRRKWPMKGWHKRYFVLDKGTLTYAKSRGDIQKGKIHGAVDIGLSVLTVKRDSRRIDIDAEDLIYHLKVKNTVLYDEWLTKLRHHRLYRQHEIAYGTREAPRLTDVTTPVDELTPITSPVSPSTATLVADRRRGSIKMRNLTCLERSQSKVAAWLLDTAGMERCNRELTAAQAHIFEMTGIIDRLNQSSLINHVAANSAVELHELSSPKKEKFGRKVAFKRGNKHRKTMSQDKESSPSLSSSMGSSSELKVPDLTASLHISSSNPNLLTHYESEKNRPTSMPENWITGGSDSRMNDAKLREDFVNTAKSVQDTLRSLTRSLMTERERLKHALDQEKGGTLTANMAYIHSLKAALTDSLKQNSELRSRLAKINAESNISHMQPSPAVEDHPLLQTTASWESTSASEFYDAAEYLVSSGATSEISDEEEEDEVSSDISDTENTGRQSLDSSMRMNCLQTGRRSRLPAPRPDADISLWSLLCKNIGKDLSKISMPVTLNEPLSMLQRLCEEMEYSELLDKAAETEDPYIRMVQVAAFSVSPYAATAYRAGQKPFNPLLGETYECIREDKGWRFLAEQVSHHPPISTSYCNSKNFIISQDMRIKSKFWGKSMEIQPVGTVHLQLPQYKDRYNWNKVTTCVHNILGGQRWVDHYGECTIKNEANGITCKLTFAKSGYWSDKRHEVYGTVTSAEGKVVHHLFGKWNEGIYYGHAPSAKCVWRPGSMPEEFELYYGFTRFAIELNEIDEEQVHLYAPTDTRFRPDQRMLEEGRIQEAENAKLRIEQSQRDRRKQREQENVHYSPRWFLRDEDKNKEIYRYTGKYWELRKDPGFMSMQFEKLW